MCNVKMIQNSLAEYSTGDYKQLIIYTRMIAGHGINGVDQYEYKSGVWYEDDEPRKHYQISNIEFVEKDGYITFDYAYRYSKHSRYDFSTKVFLPFSEIISVELLKK